MLVVANGQGQTLSLSMSQKVPIFHWRAVRILTWVRGASSLLRNPFWEHQPPDQHGLPTTHSVDILGWSLHIPILSSVNPASYWPTSSLVLSRASIPLAKAGQCQLHLLSGEGGFRHPPLIRLAILSEPKLAIARSLSQKSAAVAASMIC